ncbi:MAG: hypothetical protein U0136_13985 [Bdellovibrionota bacterium]
MEIGSINSSSALVPSPARRTEGAAPQAASNAPADSAPSLPEERLRARAGGASFSYLTSEGDRVTLTAYSQNGVSLERRATATNEVYSFEELKSAYASEGFSLQVEGDLNEAEIKDLETAVNVTRGVVDDLAHGSTSSILSVYGLAGLDTIDHIEQGSVFRASMATAFEPIVLQDNSRPLTLDMGSRPPTRERNNYVPLEERDPGLVVKNEQLQAQTKDEMGDALAGLFDLLHAGQKVTSFQALAAVTYSQQIAAWLSDPQHASNGGGLGRIAA